MGSALAFPARENNNEVRIVGTHLDREIIDACKQSNKHPKFDRCFPEGIRFYQIEELKAALEGADLVIGGVSSFGVDWFGDFVLPEIAENTPVLTVTKGLVDTADYSYQKLAQQMDLYTGGIGAVINWCDFSVSGVSCQVETSVRKAIWDSYKKGLPIGAMCIAPVLIAKVLGSEGVKVTIGNDEKVAASIVKTGAVHENKEAVEVCVDQIHKVVTTPAYMLAQSIKEVCEGADNMIKALIKLM